MEYSVELDRPMRKAQLLPLHEHDYHRVLKAAAQLLFSLTVIWAVYLLYSPMFYLRLKLYFAAYTIESLSYKSHKNCMFLLCNGILVIIFKNSGLINKSFTSSGLHLQSRQPISCKPEMGAGSLPQRTEVSEEVASAEVITPEKHGNAGGSAEITIPMDDEMEGNGSFRDTEADRVVTDDSDEDDEEMSGEELYWKCEDFIRKVRGEISLESH